MNGLNAKYLTLAAVAVAISTSAIAQTPAKPISIGPFVEITIDGNDVVSAPERVRYRLTADAGSYVTVFLVSPAGGVSVLNPYERAVAGSGRREFFREARAGYTSGRGYLVAVATRDARHNSDLIRRRAGASRFSTAYFNADAALDDLVNRTVPAAGDDFSVSYASFRILSNDYPGSYAFNQYCQYSPFSPSSAYLSGGLYNNAISASSIYGELGGFPRYFTYLDQLNLESACRGQSFFPPLLIVRGPVNPQPTPPRDTTVRADSIPKLLPPSGPRVPLPFNPDPRDAGPAMKASKAPLPSLRVDPITMPTVPVEAGAGARPSIPSVTPTEPSVPVQPLRSNPVARNDPPRMYPVPVQVDRPVRVSEPTVQWQRSTTPTQPVTERTSAPIPMREPTPLPVMQRIPPPPPPPSTPPPAQRKN